jgi:CBS domain-containing protein
VARDLSVFIVAPTDSIRVAMEKIELNKHRVVVVVDGGKVVGTVSDGDVRRAILHDVLPMAPVSRIMQLNPHVTTETDRRRQEEIVLTERVTVMPVVRDDNVLVDIVLAYEPFGPADADRQQA